MTALDPDIDPDLGPDPNLAPALARGCGVLGEEQSEGVSCMLRPYDNVATSNSKWVGICCNNTDTTAPVCQVSKNHRVLM